MSFCAIRRFVDATTPTVNAILMHTQQSNTDFGSKTESNLTKVSCCLQLQAWIVILQRNRTYTNGIKGGMAPSDQMLRE